MQISLQFPKASPCTIKSFTTPSPPPHHGDVETPCCVSSIKIGTPWKKTMVDHGLSFARFSPAAPLSSKFRLAARVEDREISGEIQLPDALQAELMPKHVAVIMDGHGRWAENRGLPIQHGHNAGLENLKQLLLHCCKFGIGVLSVYAFSTENWKRTKEEIDFLMSGYECFIQYYVKDLILRHDLQFSVIGDKSRLPQSIRSTIASAEEAGKANSGTHFVMALSYSGQYDIVDASKKIASQVGSGKLRAEDIDESVFEQQLLTNVTKFPNPDLLIRTSGELRVSNFMLWQLAYAEFYFVDKLFPDFEEADFIEALSSFQQRKRRYGGRKK
uniref:Alkyl transferase n=1 Tax=Leucophyllum frutescens TaxID=86643 RepID=A0A7G6J4K2_LEUFR|nr:cis-prenyl transferase 1 [Leucophyllum frutescens]